MEKTILNFMLIVFMTYALINILLYFPRIIGWFASLKKQKRIINNQNERIAVVVPARNESKVIGSLLNSLEKQTYKNYDLYVVVKEENDPTIKIVEDRGGVCYVCTKQTCKGEALDYGFKKIINQKNKNYAGLVIVDADCILDEHFLEEMNNSLASGRKVFQARRIVKNYFYGNKNISTFVSSANGLIWTMMDEMGNRYKSEKNITQMTIGTGIMLRMDLVKELRGWPYKKTVTEDMEFMYDCSLKNIEIYYNSYCKIYVEEAPSLIMTNKRRTRWLKGLIDSNHIYSSKMDDKKSKITFKNKYYVNCLWFVFRYIGSMTVFSIANIVYYFYLRMINSTYMNIALMYSILGFLIIFMSFFILTLVCLIIDRKNIKLSFMKKVLLLFYHPFFYMGYIPIISKALVTKVSNKWDAIDRIEVKENA